jgi:hypothetical protein
MAVLIVSFYCYFNNGKAIEHNVIRNDAISYYAYLPAAFIYHDLSLNFVEAPGCAKDVVVWPQRLPNGKKVIKTSMGLAVFYSPLFFMAHGCALLFHLEANGYSTIYQLFVGFTAVLYLFLGLLYLRKILLLYFDEQVTACTILLLTLATNMLYYITVETVSTHIVDFFLITTFVYYTLKWHEQQRLKYVIALGVVLGFLTLVRPTNVLASLLFLGYGVYDLKSLGIKMALLFRHALTLWLIPALTFVLFVPQLLYWHAYAGEYVFNSYVGERFYFNHPHILKALFGFRKGWLVYTPVMCLFFVGLFFMKGKLKQLQLPIVVFFMYGQRAYIDFYGVFAIPIAALIAASLKSHRLIYRRALFTFMALLLLLNITQDYQCKRNIIHYDSMTAAKYKAVFLRFGEQTTQSDYLLQPPDYEKARHGEEED